MLPKKPKTRRKAIIEQVAGAILEGYSSLLAYDGDPEPLDAYAERVNREGWTLDIRMPGTRYVADNWTRIEGLVLGPKALQDAVALAREWFREQNIAV